MKLTTYAWIMAAVVFVGTLPHAVGAMFHRQMETINTTINLILNRSNHDKLEALKRHNLMKCISWCDKHCIPYNRIVQNNNIFLKQ